MKVFRLCPWVFCFKDYIKTTQNFWKKSNFCHFRWLAPEKSKKKIFCQQIHEKSQSGKILWNGIKSKILIWDFPCELSSRIIKEYQMLLKYYKTSLKWMYFWVLISAKKPMVSYLIIASSFFHKKCSTRISI